MRTRAWKRRLAGWTAQCWLPVLRREAELTAGRYGRDGKTAALLAVSVIFLLLWFDFRSLTLALMATLPPFVMRMVEIRPDPLAFALFVWEWPAAHQFVWLVAIGVFGSLAQLCLSQSFRLADATLVLPIDFTKIVWASLIGYVAFGQVPEIWVWIGATVIFSAVFYNTYQVRGSRP